jgi:hypothetical protein
MLGESVNGKLQKASCVCVWKKEDEEGDSFNVEQPRSRPRR